jgi:hypothetical protein
MYLLYVFEAFEEDIFMRRGARAGLSDIIGYYKRP